MKKSGTIFVLLGIVALCSILLIPGPALAKTEFISIGTGGTGDLDEFTDIAAGVVVVDLVDPHTGGRGVGTEESGEHNARRGRLDRHGFNSF